MDIKQDNIAQNGMTWKEVISLKYKSIDDFIDKNIINSPDTINEIVLLLISNIFKIQFHIFKKDGKHDIPETIKKSNIPILLFLNKSKYHIFLQKDVKKKTKRKSDEKVKPSVEQVKPTAEQIKPSVETIKLQKPSQFKSVAEYLDTIVDNLLFIPHKCINIVKQFIVKKMNKRRNSSLKKIFKNKKSLIKNKDAIEVKKKLKEEKLSDKKCDEIVNSIDNTPPHLLKYVVNVIDNEQHK